MQDSNIYIAWAVVLIVEIEAKTRYTNEEEFTYKHAKGHEGFYERNLTPAEAPR